MARAIYNRVCCQLTKVRVVRLAKYLEIGILRHLPDDLKLRVKELVETTEAEHILEVSLSLALNLDGFCIALSYYILSLSKHLGACALCLNLCELCCRLSLSVQFGLEDLSLSSDLGRFKLGSGLDAQLLSFSLLVDLAHGLLAF